MPTDKPRVAVYLPPTLYERLQEHQQALGLKSLSKAATQALEDYFRRLDMPLTAEEKEKTLTEVKQELTQLRGRLDELSEIVARLEQGNQQED